MPLGNFVIFEALWRVYFDRGSESRGTDRKHSNPYKYFLNPKDFGSIQENRSHYTYKSRDPSDQIVNRSEFTGR
jgi:hypothetical protein